MCESAQDPRGLAGAPGDQSKSLEADHGVAAPIGEPVVAGDHGADFVARGFGAGSVFQAADGVMRNWSAASTSSAAAPSRTAGSAAESSSLRRDVSACSAASGGSARTDSQFSVEATRTVCSPAARSVRKYPGLQSEPCQS